MKILALEFSSPLRSVAVAEQPPAGQPPALLASVVSVEPRGSPFPLIDEALAKAGTAREQIELIAVGLGPGSHTGIRSAIAVAQGWQLARAVKLVGVSSLHCMAHAAWMAGLRGRIAIVIAALRDEFCLARYDLQPAGLVEMESVRLIPLAEARSLAQLESGCALMGYDLLPVLPAAREVFPDAEALARMAAHRSDFVPGEGLEPIYLRATSFLKAPPPRVL
jgi:tRNA threonylcarbamoyl adenosine modification protein YeaZ